jgi:hypothetical protein
MVRVSITEQEKHKCKQFAKNYADTVGDIYAKDRNQPDIKVIINQAYWAKLAELAVEKEIRRIGVEITEGVDFSIHQRHQKSFDSDVKTVNARLHVIPIRNEIKQNRGRVNREISRWQDNWC